METAKRRNYPYYIILGYTPPRGTLGIFVVAPSNGCLETAPLLDSTQASQSRHMSSASKLLGAPGSRNLLPSLRSWFCGSTKYRRFCSESPQTPRADSGRERLPCTGKAKSQSTPCCQSLITAWSNHPPVLKRSGPHLSSDLLLGCHHPCGGTLNTRGALRSGIRPAKISSTY
jgi:hypothetical protein